MVSQSYPFPVADLQQRTIQSPMTRASGRANGLLGSMSCKRLAADWHSKGIAWVATVLLRMSWHRWQAPAHAAPG
eukprot:scaffold396_cov339-Prasinococcus_capsulatus_cf.AAC.15